MHKQLTRDGIKIDGVRTPPAARHKYLYAAGIFDPAQRDEWQLVFHEQSRHLWSDEHRANVLRAVANAARRVTGT
jgi:hypothetical protein